MADMNMCPRSTAAFWLKGGTHTEYTWHGIRMEYMWKVTRDMAYTWNTRRTINDKNVVKTARRNQPHFCC